ncbi:hypothetical protein [Corynebacterium sp. UBA2622]|uniref:hypothetical protein n=1 Tax=Corynebacterium sp. UBA2622 TaxID=1946393 RepID=UPI0025B9B26C|nr:hypothetical protein [Corynebacterium sp. UBA2622]
MLPPLVTPETGRAARAAALAVPGVAGLDPGRFGEVAILLPGARIEGIRPSERGGLRGLEAHLVFDVSSGRDVRSVAEEARSAIAGATGADYVDVVVSDAQ